MPILSSTREISAELGTLELRGTWSSAKPSPSSSLGAPPGFSEGGPLGRDAEEEGKPLLRLGVAAAREGASDIMKPTSLEGVAIVALV